jgi:hypothetical protein
MEEVLRYFGDSVVRLHRAAEAKTSCTLSADETRSLFAWLKLLLDGLFETNLDLVIAENSQGDNAELFPTP